MMHRCFRLPLVIAVAVLTSGAFTSAGAQSLAPTELTGVFSVVWGDGRPGSGAQIDPLCFLTDDLQHTTRLLLDDEVARRAGGIVALQGRRVRVGGGWITAGNAVAQPTLSVSFVEIATVDPTAQVVSGSHPWVSVTCKFPDVLAEPQALAYFQNMYGSTYPGLDHYWREVSFDAVNLAGSGAAGWFLLPQPRSYYVYDQNGDTIPDADLNRLADDCVAVADPSVNFAAYAGINLMFNADLDDFAWGGSRFMTRDGVSKSWHITWQPPWSYNNITSTEHEIGHGFGLPHSSGAYGLTYDNVWDVMSDTWSTCDRSTHATYGCLGQHVISYHKDILGWIGGSYRFTASGQTTIPLEQLALPQSGNYRMAVVPIGGSSTLFYTVEVRRQVGYDVKLPGQAIIIHQVDTLRSRPAWVVDADNNGNTGDSGAMWTVGETFTDPANQISVAVNSATATGFVVTISAPEPMTTTTTLSSSLNPATTNASVTFTATVTPGATGNVVFQDGPYQLATVGLSGGMATFTTPFGAAGTYSIRAVYLGNGSYSASSSAVLAEVINPAAGAPAGLSATAVGTSQVALAWSAAGGASFYEVFRGTTNFGAYAFVGSSASPSFTDTSVAANAAYLYKVRAVDGFGNRSDFSAPDVATTVAFTDDPLNAGAMIVKSVHITQLRAAVNILRAACVDVPATTFTESISAGSVVKAIHVSELRNSLNEARSGLFLPQISFSEGTLTAGVTPARAIHLQELRNGVK
jgi:M6 family metalloprotease-like protein